MSSLLEIAKAAARPTRAETSSPKPVKDAPGPFNDYTRADLEEIDRLLRELARLEKWSSEELADKLDQRRRMAPVNVIPALRWLTRVVAEPEPRKKRPFRLCKLEVVELAAIDGGKK